MLHNPNILLSMNISNTVYYTIADLIEYINKIESTIGFDDNILNPNPERLKLNRLKDIYGYYIFQKPCTKANEEFISILERVNDLNSEEIRVWVQDNVTFFEQNLLLFGYTYGDANGEHKLNFYLPEFQLYIEREEFVPIIQYWYLMTNLYFSQYHLIESERKIEEPNPLDYYYVAPDPNRPSDLDIIKQILQSIIMFTVSANTFTY